MRMAYLLVLGLGLSQGGAAKDAAIKKDKDAMQGTWSVVAVTSEGKDAESSKLIGAQVIFKDDKVRGKGIRLGKDNECGYKIDPTSKIKAIDFIDQDGTVVPGIYQLDGTKLNICTTAPKSPRPGSFEPKRGSGLVLIKLRK